MFGCAKTYQIRSNTSSDQYIIHPVNVNGMAYIIEFKDNLYLVDAGAPNKSALLKKKIDALSKPLRLIYITHAHFDHYGNAQELREKYKAPIVIHEADAEAMAKGQTPIKKVKTIGILGKVLYPFYKFVARIPPTKADILVVDQQDLSEYGLDAVVMHTPGHTAGSTCLVVQEKCLFVGDTVTSRPFLHKQQYYADDWDAIQTSIQKLQQSNAIMVFPGHGDPFKGDRLNKIKLK